MLFLPPPSVGIFVTRTKSKIMKKMNQVLVEKARCAGCGDLRGARRSFCFGHSAVRGLRSMARATEPRRAVFCVGFSFSTFF